MKNQLDIVYGRTGPLELERRLEEELKKFGAEGTMYIGYPVFNTGVTQQKVDVLYTSLEYGLIVFDFQHFSQDVQSILEDVREHQDNLFTALAAKIMLYPPLRHRRTLAVSPQLISVHQTHTNLYEDNTLICTFEKIKNFLVSGDLLTAEYYRHLNAFIQNSTSLRPKKQRADVKLQNSYGAILKTIEKQVANLDPDQKKAGIESCDGPQRIRGLAGSGKTIVIAQKAALLHYNHPNWRIIITFFTQSLYQQFYNLIRKFYYNLCNDEPDWTKLRVMHSWGSSKKSGVYYEICNAMKLPDQNLNQARIRYGFQNEFNGVCKELLKSKNIPQLYDVSIVDEAQDSPQPFFEIIYHATTEPKRIIYAYDELQSLSNLRMYPPETLFGLDSNGNARVQLNNQPNRPKQDIVLPVCYRNPPWILSTALALGFGVHRVDGIVQMFKDFKSWSDVGYESDSDIDYGNPVNIERNKESSPAFFKELIDVETSLIFRSFKNREEEIYWILEQIVKSLKSEELDPDDILIIVANPQEVGKVFRSIKKIFSSKDITVHSPGIDNVARSTFNLTGSIVVSNVYRAKGNEAPMVFLMGAEYCAISDSAEKEFSTIYQGRNFLFTALTRSKAWARVTGIGDDMENLNSEFLKVKKDNFRIKFTYPTKVELDKIHTLHEDIENQRLDRSEIIRRLDSGEITWEELPNKLKKKLGERN